MNFKHFLYEIRWVILLYIIGDVSTTFFAISGGYGYECNSLLAGFGFAGVVITKFLFLGVLLACYLVVKNYSVKWWSFTKNTIAGMGAFLTVSNAAVMVTGVSIIQMMGVMI